MVNKEEIERLGGAVGSGIIDGVLDYARETQGLTGTFPFTPTFGPLPTADKFILLGASAVPYLIGHFAKKPDIKTVGEGMLLYTLPMILVRTIANAAATPAPTAGAVLALPRGARVAPKMTPGVLMPKFQYGNGNPVSLSRKAQLAGGMYPYGYVPSRPGETATRGARQAITVGPYAGGITAPKFTPGALRPKYQHGA